jgi:hypothetical protein
LVERRIAIIVVAATELKPRLLLQQRRWVAAVAAEWSGVEYG